MNMAQSIDEKGYYNPFMARRTVWYCLKMYKIEWIAKPQSLPYFKKNFKK